MLFGKKGANGDILTTVLTIVLIAVGLQYMGIVNLASITGGDEGSDSGKQVVQVEVKQSEGTCTNVEKTTLSVKNYNKYTQGTALTDGNSYWRLFSTDGSNRGDQGVFADGATKSVSPGNKLIIYAGENSSTRFVQKIDSFLGADGKPTSTVPCKGTLDIEASLAPVGTAPTFVYENANGQVNTGQDLGASNNYNFKIKLTAPADLAVGNPYLADECKTDKDACNRICFQHNTTVIDAVKLTDMKVAGESFATQGISASRGIANNLTGAGFTFSCWTFPSFEDGSELTATATIDTASVAPADNNAVNTSLAYVDYGLHTETKQEIIGVEDDTFATLVTNTPVFLTANPIDTN